ncbi:MAG TPA: cyclic pyranopterin monophosphate synthase MoaC [Spirochaetota bacterium]|nr:cyclic pyranopterin monophosphate synthase MoaC [Spirochaetota bacterium]HPJ36906.1 cyclic pyranopterin monophosphate synthase MoaC [Spirochaetota bacterium]HPQ51926.1 cyclic pyranopterin monophosphate synthase MoaC [Spirochaetota bacterium]
MSEFSHYDHQGMSRMVDVSDKAVTHRSARAEGVVRMKSETIDMIEDRLLPKGNAFEVARVAGILAAKNTSGMIPMCHPLALHYVDVDISVDRDLPGVRILSEIRLEAKTGAEMEALTAVSVAALTLYDMCKAVDKGMVIDSITLVEKKGGKSDFKK